MYENCHRVDQKQNKIKQNKTKSNNQKKKKKITGRKKLKIPKIFFLFKN